MFPEWSRMFLSVPAGWRGQPSCHMQIPGVNNKFVLLFPSVFLIFLRNPETAVKEKHDVCDPICRSWLKFTLSHSQLHSQLSPTPTIKEKGWSGEDLSYWWANFHLSAKFQNDQEKKGEYGEGGGKGWELTLCLWIDILWSMGLGNPKPELTW